MTEIKVKAWVIDKAEAEAKRYNTWIDIYSRDEDGTKIAIDGYYTVRGEIIKETEKAINVRLSTGDIVGSKKGWTIWMPKSQIA